MSIGLVFWIVMIIWLVFGVWSTWPDYKAGGLQLIPFILFLLLGWHAFGAPIRG